MSSRTLRTMGASKPIRMWIDGKCFDVKQRKKTLPKISTPCSKPKDEEPSSVRITEETSSKCLSLAEIVKGDNGKMSTSFELPSYVFYSDLFLGWRLLYRVFGASFAKLKWRTGEVFSITPDPSKSF
ncbi:unnamed protein product [Acanthoscelides obtectus]|uniref:Uncharacterized protein n=1 Tax=Acanthoscelides obtectus TaxID=200917 RepID=A0A9P0KAW6_ACAOB|nr:unnamed protein product [Acanthoscelides obtectus]CAK1660911.1 hypothetical protein AOBTE_LOCUS22329 [Acanthoscelides obtectus]